MSKAERSAPRVGSSMLVVYSAQFAAQVITITTLAVLARSVSTEAFGLMGILFPIVLLPRMIATLGYSVAAVQHSDEDQAVLSGIFWRQLRHSNWAALATGVAGPIAASFYNAPDLAPLAITMAFATVLNALSLIPIALLERRMRFAASSLVRLLAQSSASAAAITMAWQGYGVWALIAQHIVEFVVLLIAWPLSGWLPLVPSKSHLPHATNRLGSSYSLSMVILFAAQNMDKLILAAWLGSSEQARAVLGMYAQAYNLMMKPVYVVTQPLGAVMLSTLSRLQDDAAARTMWVANFFHWASLALFPTSVGLFLVADDLMQVLAPNWKQAGPILAAFAPTISAQGLINLACVTLGSRGRGKALLFVAGLQWLLLAQAIFIGLMLATRFEGDDSLPTEALLGVTVASAISMTNVFAILLPLLWFVAKTCEVPAVSLLKVLWQPLIASLAMGGVVWATRGWLLEQGFEPPTRLLAAVAVGVFVYSLANLRQIFRMLEQRNSS